MSELFKIVLTSSLTICGGVAVAVASQALIRLALEPLLDYRRLLGEIADALEFFANVSSASPPKEQEEAQDTFRRQATGLRAGSHSIPFYGLWSFFGLVPSRNKVREASRCLLGLSNTVSEQPSVEMADHRLKWRRNASDLLGFKPF